MSPKFSSFDRRWLLRNAAALGGVAALSGLLPAWARSQTPGVTPASALSGEDIALTVGHVPIRIGGRTGHGIGINGSIPGPLLRLKEGQNVRIAVTNRLEEDTSIHWHGHWA